MKTLSVDLAIRSDLTSIAWERESGGMARYDLTLPSGWPDETVFRLAERVVKFLHWSARGWRLMLAGPYWLCHRIQGEYNEQVPRDFDADLMKNVYVRPVKIEVLPLSKMPPGGGRRDCRGHYVRGDLPIKGGAV